MTLKSGCRPRQLKPSRKLLGMKATEEEHHLVTERARQAGLSVSDYLRACVFRRRVKPKPVVPPANLAIYAELARAAANLNQLAHHLNEGRVKGQAHTVSAAVLREELRRLYAHLAALRRNLVGGGP